MKNKTTVELLKIIRDSQSRLAMNLFNSLSNEEIDGLYDQIFEAEKVILSRVNE